ncbi:hypothetical protein PGT21_034305 [Puccinia graminis f. sp. tritici]|uniref:Oligopeptide transporter n=1 Tax=Puccinia graminis f. sp. tritici TaxID=56615 RepID=A0A5B0MH95_PUCGR|nr:hypothetical protein PGT21_034305 [Puccinia graminis f. sp. tritici]
MPTSSRQSGRHQATDSLEHIALPNLDRSTTSLTSSSVAEDGNNVGHKNVTIDRSRSTEEGTKEGHSSLSEKRSSKKRPPAEPLVIKKMAGVDDIPLEDDSHMPAMTCRALLTGLFISSTAAVIQQFFLFKPSRSQVQPLFLQLACLLVGRSLQNIPGPTWWNPGPYSIKENTLSAIMATAAAVGTLAVEMIATQELYEERPFHYATAMAIMLSSQLIGYGFAGLLRAPLIYSKRAVFPAVLPAVALFHSFHYRDGTHTERHLGLFKTVFFGTAIYEIFPQYIAPTLQAVNPFCLAWQHSPAVTRLFGGALAHEGLGMLSLSFDWNVVGALGPLFTPFAAQVNEWAGVLLAYLFYPVGWENSWFEGGKHDGFPFLSTQLLTHEGELYNRTAIMKEDGTGNWEMIEKLGAPYFSTSYILANIATSLAVGAAVSHCLFWGWGSITSLFTRKGLEEEEVDKHQIVCRKYAEVPLWVYLSMLFFAVSVAFLAASLTDSGLSAPALVVALVLAGVLTIASAYLKATTGASLEVEPVIQMLGGMAFPSDAFGNMWFTTYGSATVSQSISMLQDLKLGQYMHLPPISVLIFQTIGTVAGVIFNYMVMSLVVNTNRELLRSEYGNQVFTGVVLEDFQSQAISWGIFAHELFKAGARYVIVPISLGIGFLLPIPFYFLHRFIPRCRLDLVNTPLVCGTFALVLDRANAGFTMSVLVGFLSQFYARRYHPHWFHRSNYVLSAALDGGAQVTAVLLGFVVEGGAGWKRLKFPQYFLNPATIPFRERAPDYCMLHTPTE